MVGKTNGEGSRVPLEQLSAELRRASVTIGNIKFQITAENDWYAGCYEFLDSQQQNIMVNVGDYIAVKYDNSWSIGIILQATPEDEVLVKFTHPSGPWQTFH